MNNSPMSVRLIWSLCKDIFKRKLTPCLVWGQRSYNNQEMSGKLSIVILFFYIKDTDIDIEKPDRMVIIIYHKWSHTL